MIARERIKLAVEYKNTDKLPVDFGGSFSTGIHVSTLYKLRQYYGLDKHKTPVKLIEPFMGLGLVEDDLRAIIGSDVKMLMLPEAVFFGFKNENWKEWQYGDGTPVLVPELFNTVKNPDGSLFQYPQGDTASRPSAIMPKNGYYFDAVARQAELDYDNLNPDDNKEEFGILTGQDVDYLKLLASDIYNNSEYAIFNMVSSASFGDEAEVPGMSLKNPKGFRSFEEWYMAVHSHKDYIKKVFDYQCDIAIENFKKIKSAIGNKISICSVSGTDFGIQQGLLISLDTYREIYKPFHKKVNTWIHKNTEWKTFIHTCGAVFTLIPDLIDAGFDILDPVQISAAGMQPEKLKSEYGKDITFWGGAVDVQKTLPFSTPEEVRHEVRRNIEIFFKDGGFVLANIHNLQPGIPVNNIAAMIDVINEYR